MALIKPGIAVADIRGKAGGAVFAKNRAGNYIRTFKMPINRNSERQQTMRSIVGQLVQYWNNTLDAEQRSAWDSYAAAVPITNRLGEQIYRTGFNCFVGSNSLRLQAGLAIVEDGPTTLAAAETDATLAIVGTADDQKIAVTFDDTADWCDAAGNALVIYQGRPRKSTRNFFAGPYKYAGKLEGSTTTPPASGATLDAPMALVAGQKVTCQARLLLADGRYSPPFRATVVVAAS